MSNITVQINEEELHQVYLCARQRNLQHKASTSTNIFIPDQNVIGIVGEFALSKMMGIPYCWTQDHSRASIADFYFYYSEYPQPMKIDIKTVTHPNKSLMVAKYNGHKHIKPFYSFYILMYWDQQTNIVEYKGYATFQELLLSASLEPGLNDNPFYKIPNRNLHQYPIWTNEQFIKIEHR